jgi:hypothetical protein
MDSLRRALAFRFLLWLIHSAISICIFPIRQSNRPLFESTVSVVLAIANAFLNLFRRFAREGAILGVLLFAISLLLDQRKFRFGPMQMPFADHMSAIGVEYLLIPAPFRQPSGRPRRSRRTPNLLSVVMASTGRGRSPAVVCRRSRHCSS